MMSIVMKNSAFNILVLIKDDGYYYSSTSWERDIRLACLYLPAQLENILRTLHSPLLPGGMYVIQNRHSDYYAGNSWAYGIEEAKLYPTYDDAENALEECLKAS